MRRTIHPEIQSPLLSLLPDVTYAQVPYWFDGTLRPLKMDLWLPKRRVGRRPTIVWVCGGAFQQVDRHIWMGEMLWFARRGYTVASVEYRTSMEANWPAPVCDVKSAIRFLRAHADMFCVDPDRIAIMGESAGGYLASYVGVTGAEKSFDVGEHLDQSSAVQAVVDYYGVVEMSSGTPSDLSDGDTIIIKGDAVSLLLGCTERENPERCHRASVAPWIDENTPPFLILHGDQDPLVDIGQSERLYAALQAAGVRAELDVYEGITHGDDAFYQEAAKRRVAAFLDEVMGGQDA